jgi:hypothetical protein
MQTVTEPLPDEHRHFADPLEAIRQAAEGVGDLPLPELRRQMDDVHTFLVERFIPHARADEEAIYPSLQSLRELLYDLHALIELHLAKEDEFRLTLLVRRIPAAESGVGA